MKSVKFVRLFFSLFDVCLNFLFGCIQSAKSYQVYRCSIIVLFTCVKNSKFQLKFFYKNIFIDKFLDEFLIFDVKFKISLKVLVKNSTFEKKSRIKFNFIYFFK